MTGPVYQVARPVRPFRIPEVPQFRSTAPLRRLSSAAWGIVFESSTTRTETYANGSELDREPAGSLHLAASRYTPTGFRFRRRKAWGFKSLLVH